MLTSYSQLNGCHLHATDGDIGSCKDILFNEQDFVVRYLVADTNKWLPLSRQVVISPISISKLNPDGHEIQVTMSKEDIKNSPSIDDCQPISRQYETLLMKYYGYGYYWTGTGYWGEYSHPTDLVDQPDIEADNADLPEPNHLRSCDEVIDYEAETKNGHSGHIADFIIDSDTWAVTHCVVDTNNWLPGGKQHVINVNQIKKFTWASQQASFKLSSNEIEAAIVFDPERLNDPTYQQALAQVK
jgi:uncharacterized protein YrrD